MSAKILVVDDEKMLTKILAKILGQAGYRVSTVSDGDEAIDKVKQGHFDLLISDVRMPKKNGTEALPIIETLDPQLKIIILTGYPLTPELEEKVSLGRYQYIAKPFDNDDLVAKVQELVSS